MPVVATDELLDHIELGARVADFLCDVAKIRRPLVAHEHANEATSNRRGTALESH